MSQKRIPQTPNSLLLQADITALMAKATPFSEQSPTGARAIIHKSFFLSPSQALEAGWPCSHRDMVLQANCSGYLHLSLSF